MNDARGYEDTLATLAAIGYKEIEPAGGYNGMEPKAFRAMIDRRDRARDGSGTFFGGDDPSWAPSKHERVSFDQFVMAK